MCALTQTAPGRAARNAMHDLQRYLVEEFVEDYREGTLSRRDLLRRVLAVTGSVAIAANALSRLGVRGPAAVRPAPAAARPPMQRPARPDDDPMTDPPPMQTTANVVDPSDPLISAGMVTFSGPASDLYGYLAQPATGGPYPGLILVHENRGLIEPNMDIARRYARLGYVVLVVDLASRGGGTAALAAQDPVQVTGFLGQANPDDLTADLLAGLDYLAGLGTVDANRLGATGFCFGGGMTWRLATAAPQLKPWCPTMARTRRSTAYRTSAPPRWASTASWIRALPAPRPSSTRRWTRQASCTTK